MSWVSQGSKKVHKEYFTVKTENENDLDFNVSKKLQVSDDWELWGNPYIDKEGNHCQALVRVAIGSRISANPIDYK